MINHSTFASLQNTTLAPKTPVNFPSMGPTIYIFCKDFPGCHPKTARPLQLPLFQTLAPDVVTVREVGGTLAPLWPSYIEPGRTRALLYVVDASAPETLGAATLHLGRRGDKIIERSGRIFDLGFRILLLPGNSHKILANGLVHSSNRK